MHGAGRSTIIISSSFVLDSHSSLCLIAFCTDCTWIPHHSLNRLELLMRRGKTAAAAGAREEGERIRVEDWHFIIPSLPSGHGKWSDQMCTAGRATWARLIPNGNLWSQCIFNPRFEDIKRFYSYIKLYLHEEISPPFMNEGMTEKNTIKRPAGLYSKGFWRRIYFKVFF